MYTNSSTAASLAPGWHTLGSTPIKITSLSRYTGEHQPVPVFLTCILSLPPFALLWVQEEVTFAEQWNPRGRLSCLSPGCWVSTMCSSPQQYAASLQWFHTQRTMSLPPICSCIQPSTLGPLQRSHIHPSTSVIVQRATNEANYPREPPALVGDALTYIFRFGQHYTSTPHA